jgi:hypothetical protein
MFSCSFVSSVVVVVDGSAANEKELSLLLRTVTTPGGEVKANAALAEEHRRIRMASIVLMVEFMFHVMKLVGAMSQ